MNRQDVFASAQLITQHPILAQDSKLQCQYYLFLRELIGLCRLNRRKYVKAQLSFYRNTLCGGGTPRASGKGYRAIRIYSYLIPFDLAAITAYHKKLSKLRAELVAKIIQECGLPLEDTPLMETAFAAALGDQSAWEQVLQSSKLKRYRKYLRLFRDNLSFMQSRPYNILITATMSAGKSTIINALTGKNVSLVQNMAATSKIHTILSKRFDDGVTTEYDANIALEATKEELLADNDKNMSTKILASTYFYGILSGQRLSLLDSPGVNSSLNQQHSEITRKIIQAKKYHLLLYVLNATQLGTNDDDLHLRYVAKLLGRRKILFILNKADNLLSEDEDINAILRRQRNYLVSIGFKNPIICPVSARAAYLAKSSQHEPLSRLTQRELENFMDKFDRESFSAYYEQELGCPAAAHPTNEADALCWNCGFAYMENIIYYLKQGKRMED